MKSKTSYKKYIIIIAIIVIYAIVIFLLTRSSTTKQEDSTVLVVGNSAVWIKNNNNWTSLDFDSSASVLEKLSWNFYDIYVENKYLDNYYLWYSDKWYLFTKDKKAVKYTGKMLGIKTKEDIDVKFFENKEITDYSIVNKVLKKHKITYDGEYTSSNYIPVDIDSDGKDEKIYTVTNEFATDNTTGIIFSSIFLEKDDQVIEIYYNQREGDVFSGCKPYIRNILDIDGDKKYEVIVSCAYYSISGTSEGLYRLEKDKFIRMLYKY